LSEFSNVSTRAVMAPVRADTIQAVCQELREGSRCYLCWHS
jgi:hypothetical protein